MRVTPNCDSINSFYVYYDGPSPAQYAPEITFGGGYYFVVWPDNRSGYPQIYGARVTPAGSVLDPGGILISRITTATHYYPSVAWGGTRYLVVYGVYSPSPYALYGRLVNTNGTFASDTIRLATGSSSIYYTHVAYSGTNFMAIWFEYASPYTLKGILVSTNGTPIGSPFTIATNVYYFKSARVIFNGVNYFVTYSKSNGSIYELWGQHYSTTGTPVGSALKITPTANNVYWGDVVPGANSRYLNVWTEYRSSGYDIYANIDAQMIGIEEKTDKNEPVCYLKSTIVKDIIQLVNTEREAEIYDAAGSYLGKTTDGIYDCSRIKPGVYFVQLKPGRAYKVIKIR